MLALLAQLASAERNPRANAERAAEAIAGHPQADLAVFPELYLSGYTMNGLDELARSADAPELRLIAEAAARASTAVVVGFPERREGGRPANAAACIDRDGSLAAVYRKTQLFGAEEDAFEPGEELMIVELAGTRVGPLVCFDVEFPETARQLGLAGAELVAVASANMDPFYVDHEVATRARAVENRLPLVYANAVGDLDGLTFVGGSRSVAPSGEILAEAAEGTERLLLAPVAEPGDVDERVDYLRHLPGELRVTNP
ncbi:MAG TPA: nitrilase-related carbon-nitrogen hydrolase [Gaiellaceae bacterium]|jgi:predicted amidohydrolase|nr:nitrilase-related carbon-nitrogen hydrolase [Gaiellaceae bacterium]